MAAYLSILMGTISQRMALEIPEQHHTFSRMNNLKWGATWYPFHKKTFELVTKKKIVGDGVMLNQCDFKRNRPII